MTLVTIEQLRFQVRADADEGDELISLFGEAAEAACQALCNRYLYVDAAALQAARDALPAAMAAASAAYETAMDAAASIDDDRERDTAEQIAKKDLQDAEVAQAYTLHGLVVTPDLIAAILLTATDFYNNREAGDVPAGARNTCFRYRHIGE